MSSQQHGQREYVARIRCDWCRREKRLDLIRARYRPMKQTAFICADCASRNPDPATEARR